MGVNLPIVLVANKSDLVSEREVKRALTEEMVPVMQEFKEVESCIRCSAKSKININEVFYLCQRAVTHPIVTPPPPLLIPSFPPLVLCS